MSTPTKIITIAFCKKNVAVSDTDLYTGEDWLIHPSDDFLGVPGFVLAKLETKKPEWLEMIIENFPNEPDLKNIEDTTAHGFWIVSLHGRTVVACFAASEKFLNRAKLDPAFPSYQIEVPTDDLKNAVLEHLKQATI